MYKYIIGSVGTSIGAGFGDEGGLGRLGGASAGYVTANMIAALFANPNVRLAVVRQLIKNMRKAGRTDLVEEAQKILQNESSKYLLPSAGKTSYVEKAIVLPENVRDYNLGLNEVKNTKFGQSAPIRNALQMAEPKQAPTIQANMNENISPNTITLETKMQASIVKAKASGQSFDEWVKGQGENNWSKLQKTNPDLFNTGILRKSQTPYKAVGEIPKDVHTLQGKWQNYGQYDEIPADVIYKRIYNGSF